MDYPINSNFLDFFTQTQQRTVITVVINVEPLKFRSEYDHLKKFKEIEVWKKWAYQFIERQKDYGKSLKIRV